jgi:phosphatidate cytidylyltransferase
MLRWRLLLGTLLVAALVGLCWLDAKIVPLPSSWIPVPGLVLLPIAIVVALMATGELLDLLAAANIRPVPWIVYLANVCLIASCWVTLSLNISSASLLTDAAIPIAAAMLAIFAIELFRFRKPGGNMVNLAGAAFALLYVGLTLRFAVYLRLISIGALASWIIVVKMCDIGAYTVGRLIGRHKMAPHLSPGKTIEGAVGGLAFACLGSWAAFRWLMPIVAPLSDEPAWWGWLVFGLLVGGAGMIGDLAESLLKRDVGRKDSSTWLPGFGGVLDIVDSLLLSAPVAWFCWATGIVGR